MNATNYRLVKSDDPSEVERQVALLINEGYDVFGSPLVLGNILLVQACIKRPPPKVKKEDEEDERFTRSPHFHRGKAYARE